MAKTVKSKEFIGVDANCTDGKDLSKCSKIYNATLEGDGQEETYENLHIPHETVESEIDAALILAANPF